MLQKISILVIFFIAVGIGFFAILIDKRMEQEPEKVQSGNQSEVYCRYKGGDIEQESSEVYCTYGELKELAQDFFDRLGEWESSEIEERSL